MTDINEAFQSLCLTSTMTPQILGGGMRRRTSIGIALLALSHLVSANVSSALAQAGSTGGTIGKQDKSISGGEEADKPGAAPRSKRPITSNEASPGFSCRRIVGRWKWGPSVMTFSQNGTVRQSVTGNTGTWTCSGAVVRSVMATGDRDRAVLSDDGNSASVTTTWAGGLTFTVTRLGGD
jgi:hypothetical protein